MALIAVSNFSPPSPHRRSFVGVGVPTLPSPPLFLNSSGPYFFLRFCPTEALGPLAFLVFCREGRGLFPAPLPVTSKMPFLFTWRVHEIPFFSFLRVLFPILVRPFSLFPGPNGTPWARSTWLFSPCPRAPSFFFPSAMGLTLAPACSVLPLLEFLPVRTRDISPPRARFFTCIDLCSLPFSPPPPVP